MFWGGLDVTWCPSGRDFPRFGAELFRRRFYLDIAATLQTILYILFLSRLGDSHWWQFLWIAMTLLCRSFERRCRNHSTCILYIGSVSVIIREDARGAAQETEAFSMLSSSKNICVAKESALSFKKWRMMAAVEARRRCDQHVAAGFGSNDQICALTIVHRCGPNVFAEGRQRTLRRAVRRASTDFVRPYGSAQLIKIAVSFRLIEQNCACKKLSAAISKFGPDPPVLVEDIA